MLEATAIRIEVGEGREDRLTSGSYQALRSEEELRRKQRQRELLDRAGDDYLPDAR